MARVCVKVTGGGGANPAHPSLHIISNVATSGETGDVYVSYDTTKVTGYQQLHSLVAAALNGLANGNFVANS